MALPRYLSWMNFVQITGLPLVYEKELNSSHAVVDEHLKALLATSVNPKKLKKKAQAEKKEDSGNDA